MVKSNRAAAHSSPQRHPPPQKPTVLPRAALWAHGERPCRLDANEEAAAVLCCLPKVADSTAFGHPGKGIGGPGGALVSATFTPLGYTPPAQPASGQKRKSVGRRGEEAS